MVDSMNARSHKNEKKNVKEEYAMNKDEYKQIRDQFKENFKGMLTSAYYEYFDANHAKTSNEKQRYYLDIAAAVANHSPMLHKHGAIIVYKNKIIASGYNYYFANFSIHAEIAAIKSIKGRCKHLLSECELYVVRIAPERFNHALKYSKPCCNCQHTIIKNNIKKAFYSTNYSYDIIRENEKKINEL